MHTRPIKEQRLPVEWLAWVQVITVSAHCQRNGLKATMDILEAPIATIGAPLAVSFVRWAAVATVCGDRNRHGVAYVSLVQAPAS